MTRKRRKILGILSLLLIVATLLTYLGARQFFLREIAREAQSETSVYREILQGWLGRYRALPSIYAGYSEVIETLRTPNPPNISRLNHMLEAWNSASGASDIYVLDKTGMTIAASNWEEPHSFVGENYNFRPYYIQAMQGRLGRFFALGLMSQKRGYYFSYPVRFHNEIIGVLVLKLTVEEIEQELRSKENEIFVANEDGVVIMASHPAWRLTLLEPLNVEEKQRIRNERQFNLGDLNSIQIENVVAEPDPGQVQLVKASPDRSNRQQHEFVQLVQPMATEGWNLHLLVSTEKAVIEAVLVTMVVASILIVLILIIALMLQRRDRLIQMLEFRERARKTLEQTVEERTADLLKSNENLRQTQSELVQAGKLAALGQMSTALSHEFNQPLTAIRTYAENARAFLDREMGDQARENMRRIMTLTERMAMLSKRLSNFARKPNDTMRPVRLMDAIEEALALLEARLARSGVDVIVEVDENIWFLGGQVRLQHVIMNLVVNAMDAMANVESRPSDTPMQAAVIRIEAQRKSSGRLDLRVSDTGPGIAVDNMSKIFDPFFTTKDVGQGVGLGLSISYNIIKDFGGMMTVVNLPDGGACFIVELQQANPQQVQDEISKADGTGKTND